MQGLDGGTVNTVRGEISMNTLSPHEKVLEIMKNMVPSMRYDGKEDYAQWQKKAREKCKELLGLSQFQKCALEVQIEQEIETEEYVETRFCFQSEEHYRIPCHLRMPKGAGKPLPVMICLQGHTTGMHISLGNPKFQGDEARISNGDRDFANRVIKEGYCALIMEQRDMGECGGNEEGPQCYVPSTANLLIGRTTLGERVWDVQRAIDVIVQYFPQIDAEKIMCMGNSGGGTTAFYAACIDERIKAVMPSCAICTFDDSIAAMSHCICNFVPGMRKYFDMCDLGGLIVPRRMVMVSGREDEIFPLKGAEKTAEFLKQLYTCNGAAEQFQFVVGEGGHRFYADDAWPVLKRGLWEDSNSEHTE